MVSADPAVWSSYFFYPRPVAIIGVRDVGRGTVNVAPATWTTPLGSSPPLFGVCLSPSTHTHHLVLAEGEFTLSFLEHRHAALVAAIGRLSGRDVDKVAALGLRLTPAETVGGAFLADAYAAAECVLVSRHQTGDQTLMVGEVQLVHAAPEVFDERGVLRGDRVRPLLYLGGGAYVGIDPTSVVDGTLEATP